MNTAMDAILNDKLIVIARRISEEKICNLAQAISSGGLSCLEVTFDHSCPEGINDTLRCVSRLKKHFGNRMAIGVGTTLTPEEVRMAADAGAQYVISPDVNAGVIAETKKMGLLSIPGAMTPTEIRTAFDLGADIVKLFPASSLGPDYVKALKGPFPHIPLLAAGGVTPANIGAYLKAGIVGAGCAGDLVNRKWIDEGLFENITDVARQYVAAIRGENL